MDETAHTGFETVTGGCRASYPSKKALASVVGKVRSITRRNKHRTLAALLRRLNPVLRGWCNYFRYGVSSRTFGCLDETCSSGSERGSRKRTGRNPGTAPRPNPYSKLQGPAKRTWFYLYVILDVLSRYIVGWAVQYRGTAQLAKALIEQAT